MVVSSAMGTSTTVQQRDEKSLPLGGGSRKCMSPDPSAFSLSCRQGVYRAPPHRHPVRAVRLTCLAAYSLHLTEVDAHLTTKATRSISSPGLKSIQLLSALFVLFFKKNCQDVDGLNMTQSASQ